MAISNEFTTIITKRNVDSNSNPISVSLVEKRQVMDGHSCVVLSQLPSETYRVYVQGFTECFKQDEIGLSTYYVSYSQGVVYFDPRHIGKVIIVEYEGIGYEVISASRVYYKLDLNGNITQTLEEIFDKMQVQFDLIGSLGDAVVIIEKLETDIVNAQNVHNGILEDINAISSTGNKVYYISSTDWNFNESNGNYEYSLTHDLDSKSLLINSYYTDTDEVVYVNYKIIDINNILITNVVNKGITVVLNARYYKPQDTLNSIIQEEVVEARVGKVDLKTKITDIDNKIIETVDYTNDKIDYTNSRINDVVAKSVTYRSDFDYSVENPLVLADFSNYNQPYHPSVLYIEDGIDGYKYWLAQTPYPIGSTPYRDRWESPCIYKSNDGIIWEVVANPLDDLTSEQIVGKDFLSDPHLVYVNGKLECWYRYTDVSDSNHTWILRKTTSDGKTWSSRETIIDCNVYGMVRSQSLIYEDGKYKMWFTGQGNSSDLGYAESSDGINWGARTNCVLSNTMVAWHIDVKNIKGTYYLLSYVKATNSLELYQSIDGINFTYMKQVLQKGGSSFYTNGLYRACMMLDEIDCIRVYFTAETTTKTSIGVMVGVDFDSLKIINATSSVGGGVLVADSRPFYPKTISQNITHDNNELYGIINDLMKRVEILETGKMVVTYDMFEADTKINPDGTLGVQVSAFTTKDYIDVASFDGSITVFRNQSVNLRVGEYDENYNPTNTTLPIYGISTMKQTITFLPNTRYIKIMSSSLNASSQFEIRKVVVTPEIAVTYDMFLADTKINPDGTTSTQASAFTTKDYIDISAIGRNITVTRNGSYNLRVGEYDANHNPTNTNLTLYPTGTTDLAFYLNATTKYVRIMSSVLTASSKFTIK